MENASKALIIAGSVLIALIIIGALLLMFNNLSNYQDTNVETTREAQVLEFNNQYETYNRNDVRGSDIYSLLGRVVDYNRRKSDVATGTDEGKNLQFQPMTIVINFGSQDKLESFTYDKKIRLFKDVLNKGINGKYEFKLEQSTTNRFYDVINVKISNIESNYGGKASVNNLAAGISNLFLSGSPSEEDKRKAENLYKKNTGKEVSFINLKNDMDSDRGIYTDICTYYEYIQFKRAHFNCTDSKYNERTGRIIELDFEFNGKIE